jgi:uncharacterized damage-inducible protein DinB
MSISELLLNELKNEAASTRKILALVPDAHLDWQPHEKSFTLGRMASHVAELPLFLNRILDADEYDIATRTAPPYVCADNADLLNHFETRLAEGMPSLEKATDEHLAQDWVFRRGEIVLFKHSRYAAIRSWMFNHHIHHRGQLSVYLRMLDVAIPGMYGPSADDIIARQKAAAEANS